LSVVHALVPPHPGPLLAVNALGAHLGLTLLYGRIGGIPTAISAGPLSGADIGLLMLVSVERSGTGEAGAGTASLSCRPARLQRRFR